jgi:hypothetical protein
MSFRSTSSGDDVLAVQVPSACSLKIGTNCYEHLAVFAEDDTHRVNFLVLAS